MSWLKSLCENFSDLLYLIILSGSFHGLLIVETEVNSNSILQISNFRIDKANGYQIFPLLEILSLYKLKHIQVAFNNFSDTTRSLASFNNSIISRYCLQIPSDWLFISFVLIFANSLINFISSYYYGIKIGFFTFKKCLVDSSRDSKTLVSFIKYRTRNYTCKNLLGHTVILKIRKEWFEIKSLSFSWSYYEEKKFNEIFILFRYFYHFWKFFLSFSLELWSYGNLKIWERNVLFF